MKLKKGNIPFIADIDLNTGVIKGYTRRWNRKLSEMKNIFYNRQEVEKILDKGIDPVLYEVYNCETEPESGMLSFGTCKIYPGKIGKEYHMIKGHYHLQNATEFYLCLKGTGIVLMQSKDHRKVVTKEIERGKILYVPPNWAHRAVNVGNEEFIFLGLYPSNAGHDYNSIIAEGGFKKIAIEKDNRPTIIDNPRYGK